MTMEIVIAIVGAVIVVLEGRQNQLLRDIRENTKGLENRISRIEGHLILKGWDGLERREPAHD